jgi:hypothetical protein
MGILLRGKSPILSPAFTLKRNAGFLYPEFQNKASTSLTRHRFHSLAKDTRGLRMKGTASAESHAA